MGDAHWRVAPTCGAWRPAARAMAALMHTVFSKPVLRTDFRPYKAEDWREPRVSFKDPWQHGTIVLKSDHDPFKTPGGGSTDKAELLWFPAGNDNSTLSVKLSAIKTVEFPHKDDKIANAGPFRIVRLITTGERGDLQTTIMFRIPEAPEEDCAKFVDTLDAFLGPRVVPPLFGKTSELVHLFGSTYVLGIVVLSREEEALDNKEPVAKRYGADYTFLFQPEHLIAVKTVLHREGIVNIMISQDQWNEWLLDDSFFELHKTLDGPDVVVYFHESFYKHFTSKDDVLNCLKTQSVMKRIRNQDAHLGLYSIQRDYSKWRTSVQVDLVSDSESSAKDDEALPEEVQDAPPPRKRNIDELVGEFLEEHKRTRAEWETTEKVLKDNIQHARRQRDSLYKRLQEVEEKHKGVLDELKEQARIQSARADKSLELQNEAKQQAQEALNLAGLQADVARRALKWRIGNDSGNRPPSMTLPNAGCTVCFDAEAEWACVPCGHIVACNACKDTDVIWKTSKCPLCNAFRFPDNHGLLRVFTSGVCV